MARSNPELQKVYQRYSQAKHRYRKAILENDPKAANWLALMQKHFAAYQKIKDGG